MYLQALSPFPLRLSRSSPETATSRRGSKSWSQSLQCTSRFWKCQQCDTIVSRMIGFLRTTRVQSASANRAKASSSVGSVLESASSQRQSPPERTSRVPPKASISSPECGSYVRSERMRCGATQSIIFAGELIDKPKCHSLMGCVPCQDDPPPVLAPSQPAVLSERILVGIDLTPQTPPLPTHYRRTAIPLDFSPYSLAYSAGRLYVCGKYRLVQLDLQLGLSTVLDRDHVLQCVRVDSKGRRLVASSYSSKQLFEMDLGSENRVLTPIPGTSFKNQCLGLLVDQDYIIFSDTDSNRVVRLENGLSHGVLGAGGRGRKLPFLNFPTGLANVRQSLLACDRDNKRIVLLRQGQAEELFMMLTKLEGPKGMVAASNKQAVLVDGEKRVFLLRMGRDRLSEIKQIRFEEQGVKVLEDVAVDSRGRRLFLSDFMGKTVHRLDPR